MAKPVVRPLMSPPDSFAACIRGRCVIIEDPLVVPKSIGIFLSNPQNNPAYSEL